MKTDKVKYYAIVELYDGDMSQAETGLFTNFGKTSVYAVTEYLDLGVHYIQQFPHRDMYYIKIDKTKFDMLISAGVTELGPMLDKRVFSDAEIEMIYDIYGGWETIDYNKIYNMVEGLLEKRENGEYDKYIIESITDDIDLLFSVFISDKIRIISDKLVSLISKKKMKKKHINKAREYNNLLNEVATEILNDIDEETIDEEQLLFSRAVIHGLRPVLKEKGVRDVRKATCT